MIEFFQWAASLPQAAPTSVNSKAKEDYDEKPDRSCGVTVSCALPASSQAPPAKDEAVHNELRALRDGLIDAMNKGDIDREITYMHPNVVITWHNAEVSRGRDGVRAYLTRMLSGPNKVVSSYSATVDVDELTILYGGDTGFPSVAPSSISNCMTVRCSIYPRVGVPRSSKKATNGWSPACMLGQSV